MDSLLSLVPSGIDLSLEDVEEILRFARSLGIKRVSNKSGRFRITFAASREQVLSSGKVRIGTTVAFGYANRGDFIELTDISGLEGMLKLTVFGHQVLPWMPIHTVRLTRQAYPTMVRVSAEVEVPVIGKMTHDEILPMDQVPIFKQSLLATRKNQGNR